MTPHLLAAAGPSPLWYLTRGTGLVSLILLTVSVVLGILNVSRWSRPGWPRFATGGLHRNVSLLVVVLLAVHIITAELDTFAPVGWPAVIIPFVSSYRPIWLGLGTLAFDLIVALVVTSLLRTRLGYRTWRAVHWASYLSWPVALVHGLGTGTDPRLGWVQLIAAACTAAVAVAVAWRLSHGWRANPAPRAALALTSVVALVAVAAWSTTGPLRAGWAKRAGTPPSLLSTSRVAAGTSPAAPAPAPSPASSAIPPPPFSATVSGTIHQAGPDANGLTTVTIDTRMSGKVTGQLLMVLRGASDGGGISLRTSRVTFDPTGAPAAYHGQVTALEGDQLAAPVSSGSGSGLNLGVNLQIDPSSGSVQGTVDVTAAGGQGAESEGGR